MLAMLLRSVSLKLIALKLSKAVEFRPVDARASASHVFQTWHFFICSVWLSINKKAWNFQFERGAPFRVFKISWAEFVNGSSWMFIRWLTEEMACFEVVCLWNNKLSSFQSTELLCISLRLKCLPLQREWRTITNYWSRKSQNLNCWRISSDHWILIDSSQASLRNKT